MRRPLAMACATIVLIWASGCGSPAGPPPTSDSAPEQTAHPSWSLPPVEGLSPAPVGVEDDTQPGVTITPLAVPTWDAASRAAAVGRAAEIMTAFARPARPYEDWWADLAPLLSEQAQQDYSFVDPANIPVHTVTGDPVLVDESSAFLARVEVPTDAGVYELLLSRTDATAPWVGESITPPAGVN